MTWLMKFENLMVDVLKRIESSGVASWCFVVFYMHVRPSVRTRACTHASVHARTHGLTYVYTYILA